MSESLIIQGKQYISARRAAEIAGYSNDYVGQLCRKGKLICQMVGRFWYVDEKSLIKHKEESFTANQTSFGANGFIAKNSIRSGAYFLPILKQAFFVVLTLVAVIAVGVAAISISKPFLPQTFSQAFSETLTDNTASLYSVVSVAGGILHNAFDQSYADMTSAVFHVSPSNPSVTFTSSGSTTSADGADQGDDVSMAHAGLVVVPQNASSTSVTDAKLAQTITNSFSDNVTITPAANGTTGVITPQFRTVSGHDFLYVLVPVKTASSTPASDGTSTMKQS